MVTIKCGACNRKFKLIRNRLKDVVSFECDCGHWVGIPPVLRDQD